MNRSLPEFSSREKGAHQGAYSRTVFGFWLYLLTDCILFAILFAVFAVLRSATAGGPDLRNLIDLRMVLLETLLLLASSFTIAMGTLHVIEENLRKLIAWLFLTFLLGAFFLALQIHDMAGLVAQGASWSRSAMLSAYSTLIGVHGVHIFFGLFFMVFFTLQLLRRGFTEAVLIRLTCLRLFWLFLDLIWIVMFTYVYLLGGGYFGY